MEIWIFCPQALSPAGRTGPRFKAPPGEREVVVRISVLVVPLLEGRGAISLRGIDDAAAELAIKPMPLKMKVAIPMVRRVDEVIEVRLVFMIVFSLSVRECFGCAPFPCGTGIVSALLPSPSVTCFTLAR